MCRQAVDIYLMRQPLMIVYFQVMVAVVFVYYLTKCCARDTGLLDTPSGTPTITNADGTVSNGDECYPQYPGFDSVLVGYGNTRIGSCNGPACTLNDGRKPIKVAFCVRNIIFITVGNVLFIMRCFPT